ncbi:unnamed protein product [Rhizophagus irregularis]|nr:unnamed protein product [Rhizophagus irregularis]
MLSLIIPSGEYFIKPIEHGVDIMLEPHSLMLYNLQVIWHGRSKNSRDTSCFNDTSTINGRRTIIRGRTDKWTFFFFFTGNWSFSFVQIFSLTDERFGTLEDIKIDGTDKQKSYIQDFRSISTLRAILFHERVYLRNKN